MGKEPFDTDTALIDLNKLQKVIAKREEHHHIVKTHLFFIGIVVGFMLAYLI